MFGKRLASFRRKKKISQKELGEMLNLSQRAISRYENGETEPDIRTLIKMAEIFDVSIDTLLLDNETIIIRKEKYDHLIELAKQMENLSIEFAECLWEYRK